MTLKLKVWDTPHLLYPEFYKQGLVYLTGGSLVTKQGIKYTYYTTIDSGDKPIFAGEGKLIITPSRTFV